MNAVLITANIVVSIFGFQVGSPAIQFVPYPNMEVCQQYAKYNEGVFQLDSEYRLVKQTQCVTMEEYERIVNQNQSPP